MRSLQKPQNGFARQGWYTCGETVAATRRRVPCVSNYTHPFIVLDSFVQFHPTRTHSRQIVCPAPIINTHNVTFIIVVVIIIVVVVTVSSPPVLQTPLLPLLVLLFLLTCTTTIVAAVALLQHRLLDLGSRP